MCTKGALAKPDQSIKQTIIIQSINQFINLSIHQSIIYTVLTHILSRKLKARLKSVHAVGMADSTLLQLSLKWAIKVNLDNPINYFKSQTLTPHFLRLPLENIYSTWFDKGSGELQYLKKIAQPFKTGHSDGLISFYYPSIPPQKFSHPTISLTSPNLKIISGSRLLVLSESMESVQPYTQSITTIKHFTPFITLSNSNISPIASHVWLHSSLLLATRFLSLLLLLTYPLICLQSYPVWNMLICGLSQGPGCTPYYHPQ